MAKRLLYNFFRDKYWKNFTSAGSEVFDVKD